MAKQNHAKSEQKCAISGRALPRSQLVPLELLRPNIAERIRKEHPELPPDALIGIGGRIDNCRRDVGGNLAVAA